MIATDKFIKSQLEQWPEAKANYDALENVQRKNIFIDDAWVIVEYNPKRRNSTVAKVDQEHISQRPCFLCKENRPEQQIALSWKDYEILVNPYPIFPRHFTIAANEHIPQRIDGRLIDMAQLAKEMPGFVVFYNGPKCGASAPDHMHFQAGDARSLPLFRQKCVKDWLAPGISIPCSISAAYPSMIRVEASTPEQLALRAKKVLEVFDADFDTGEPKVNIVSLYYQDKYIMAIIPRKAHRPDFYGEGEGQMLLSPASVDLCGLYITPRKEDFLNIDAGIVQQTLYQLCYTNRELKYIMQGLS